MGLTRGTLGPTVTDIGNKRCVSAGALAVIASLVCTIACGRMGYEELTPKAGGLLTATASQDSAPDALPASPAASLLNDLAGEPPAGQPAPPATEENELLGSGSEALLLTAADAAVPAPETGAETALADPGSTQPEQSTDVEAPAAAPPTVPDGGTPAPTSPEPDSGLVMQPAPPPTLEPEQDAGVVAPPAKAGPPSTDPVNPCSTLSGAWTLSAPQHLPELSSPGYDAELSFSADGLNLYFVSPRDGASNQLFLSQRDNLQQEFGAPSAVDVSGHQSRFSVFAGNTMAIQSSRSDLYLRSRNTTSDAWSDLVSLDELNTSSDEWDPWVSQDGLRLYYASNADGPLGLYLAQRATQGDPFSAPAALANVNTAEEEGHPALSPDESVLTYTLAVGDLADIWYATRGGDGAFYPIGPLPVINSPENDGEATFSPDGCSLYFSSERPGGLGWNDFYRSQVVAP